MIYTTPSGTYPAMYKDALSQPHLLIAGSTGSGKSVFLNGVLRTALFCAPGSQQGGVEFIMIDPKRVELSAYRDLPHTLRYASEPETMVSALDYALSITESRYRGMQEEGVRKFSGGDVYVIIDEFADLMTTNRKQVMPKIQRLAQIGRAAKVHIILCTQTPIAKVLPTEIKCNFDSRVGLHTRSRQDSVNIMGHSGCELLPRYGECLYYTPSEYTRYIVPMYSDAEIEEMVQFWLDQKPEAQQKKGFLSRLFS